LAAEHTTAIFVAELILLLFFGRMFGELMTRVGQPAIFGQLLAGVLLGPSIFGALLPEIRAAVFPDTPALKSMIDAIPQIGVLLLLLLTGMETNLALVNRKRRAVISTSLFGIAVPFVCGMLLAYALPTELIPTSAARVVTALFLGTALSISSVKIVAMVLMEVDAIRRDLGQLMLATAILDDTLAWVIIAVIAGIAAHGALNVTNVGGSVAGTALFLAISLTVGRRLVARVIRWTNDNMTIEVPVITAILLVMLVMALSTELIGVHTALGAFVAGMLVGQSPILTEHIEGELRGFIIAFFSPVFFAVAGLGMDLRTLLDPTLLIFTMAIIIVASVGKFLGALAGGRLGGITGPESLALAIGLNARGSTEVIIASIGLSMGALSNQLYTMIVAMAIVTTMVMPPTLRWVLTRVPLREEEAKRLEREQAEERQSVPKMERALVVVDASPNARLAASLAGMFAAQQQVLATIMATTARNERDSCADLGQETFTRAAKLVLERTEATSGGQTAPSPQLTPEELVHTKSVNAPDTVETEIAKGYSIAFVGINQPIRAGAGHFEDQLQRLVEEFHGPVAIALNGARFAARLEASLDILVPTGGTPAAHIAMEIALALAKASDGRLTALHVFDPQDDAEFLRGRARRQGLSLLVDARRLGKRSGVPVRGVSVMHSRPEVEIQRAARAGRYGLVVIGTSLRRGERKFLSPRSLVLVHALRTPVLLIAG
jgi:Kef-type K+ transport system membrane component KefB/nucleotide-binding universal stress UspA family protein